MAKIEVKTAEGLNHVIQIVKEKNFEILGLKLEKVEEDKYISFLTPDKKFQLHSYTKPPVVHLRRIKDGKVIGQRRFNIENPHSIISLLFRLGLVDKSNKIVKKYLNSNGKDNQG